MSALTKRSAIDRLGRLCPMAVALPILVLLVMNHAQVEGSSDWSLEYDPSDPIQTAIITISFILIFIGIIFLIYIILTLCTPARRKRREHRRHCRHHCRPKSTLSKADGHQSHAHPQDPRSPGPPRHDFHPIAARLTAVTVPDDQEPNSDEVPEVVIRSDSPAVRKKSIEYIVPPGSQNSDQEEQDIASAGHAERYRKPIKIQPRYSREEMVNAVLDGSPSKTSHSASESVGTESTSAGSAPLPSARSAATTHTTFSSIPFRGKVRSISEYAKEKGGMERFRDMDSVATNKTQILVRDPNPKNPNGDESSLTSF